MAKRKKHSLVGASSAYRWMACPGSVGLYKKLPDEAFEFESPEAKAGTDAHGHLEKILKEEQSVRDVPEKDGMREAVQMAVDVIRSLIAGKGKSWWVEHKFNLSQIHKDCFGTADLVVYDSVKKMLHVVDYKHGKGVLVDPEWNKQLMYYGLGALTSLSEVGEVDTVRLTIIQPRAEHHTGQFIRSWDLDPTYLYDFSQDLLEAVLESEKPGAALVPGSHCRFCLAAASCPELHQLAQAQAEKDFSPVVIDEEKRGLREPKTTEEVARALKVVPILKGWLKSVQEYAYFRAMSGEVIPGYKLCEKRPTRKWQNEDLAIEYFEQKGFVEREIFKAPQIRTPADFEKVNKLNKKEKLAIEHLIVKESSGLTLAPEYDKRPAVTPGALAEKEFAAIEPGEFDDD